MDDVSIDQSNEDETGRDGCHFENQLLSGYTKKHSAVDIDTRGGPKNKAFFHMTQQKVTFKTVTWGMPWRVWQVYGGRFRIKPFTFCTGYILTAPAVLHNWLKTIESRRYWRKHLAGISSETHVHKQAIRTIMKRKVLACNGKYNSLQCLKMSV